VSKEIKQKRLFALQTIFSVFILFRKAIRDQLNYVRRDIKSIHTLFDAYQGLPFPLKPKEQKYLFVVQTLYEQQKQMHDNKIHSIDHSIVSIHQPHVRPIMHGKA